MDVVLPDEAKAAEAAQMLVFHSVGDTGGIHGDDVQKAISEAMAHRIANPDHNKYSSAFYYNLGDVVYFNTMGNALLKNERPGDMPQE